MQRRSSSDCSLSESPPLAPLPSSTSHSSDQDRPMQRNPGESSFRPGGLLASRKSLQPGDLAHPVETGFYNPERRLSIQMGAVMVSFDVACCEQTEVPEDELLSGYKTPTYPSDEGPPLVEHQSPEHESQTRRSRDDMQKLLKEHQEIVNKLKEQERNLSDSEHQDGSNCGKEN